MLKTNKYTTLDIIIETVKIIQVPSIIYNTLEHITSDGYHFTRYIANKISGTTFVSTICGKIIND